MGRSLAALAAIALAMVLFIPAALAPREFAGDEAAKISESYYFGLPPDHPDWFRSAIERTNPPVGKYAFGAAIVAAGRDLPPDPEIAWRPAEQRYVPPPGRERLFRAAATPARVVSAVTMSIVFGLVVWLTWGWGGPAAACIAVLLLWRHFLTMTLGSLATFDALQTLLILAAVAILAPLRDASATQREWMIRAVASGALIGLAFQTRLNGVLALVPALLLILAATSAVRRTRVLAATVLLLSCGFVTIAVNPFYWTPYIFERVRWQLRDVDAVLGTLASSIRTETLGEKLQFFFSVIGSGVAGKAILAGVALSLVALWRRRSPHLVTALLAGGSLAVVFALWLPVRWERYVFPSLPLLVCAAALGWAAIFDYVVDRLRSSSRDRISSATKRSHV